MVFVISPLGNVPLCACVCGVFAADNWNCGTCGTCGVTGTRKRRPSLPQKQRFKQLQHAGSVIAGMSVGSSM